MVDAWFGILPVKLRPGVVSLTPFSSVELMVGFCSARSLTAFTVVVGFSVSVTPLLEFGSETAAVDISLVMVSPSSRRVTSVTSTRDATVESCSVVTEFCDSLFSLIWGDDDWISAFAGEVTMLSNAGVVVSAFVRDKVSLTVVSALNVTRSGYSEKMDFSGVLLYVCKSSCRVVNGKSPKIPSWELDVVIPMLSVCAGALLEDVVNSCFVTIGVSFSNAFMSIEGNVPIVSPCEN